MWDDEWDNCTRCSHLQHQIPCTLMPAHQLLLSILVGSLSLDTHFDRQMIHTPHIWPGSVIHRPRSPQKPRGSATSRRPLQRRDKMGSWSVERPCSVWLQHTPSLNKGYVLSPSLLSWSIHCHTYTFSPHVLCTQIYSFGSFVDCMARRRLMHHAGGTRAQLGICVNWPEIICLVNLCNLTKRPCRTELLTALKALKPADVLTEICWSETTSKLCCSERWSADTLRTPAEAEWTLWKRWLSISENFPFSWWLGLHVNLKATAPSVRTTPESVEIFDT